MTGQQALDLLMGRLSRSNPTLRAKALNEMNLVQSVQLEKGAVLPWFLISEDAEAFLPSDGVDRRVVVPDDFLREVDEALFELVLEDGSVRTLIKGEYDALKEKWKTDQGLASTGESPYEYALMGGYFHFFPIPTVELTVRMKYYQAQDPIADDSTTNAWLTHAPDLIIGEAGVIVASLHVKDPEAAGGFALQATTARNRLDVENTARAEANISRRMG